MWHTVAMRNPSALFVSMCIAVSFQAIAADPPVAADKAAAVPAAAPIPASVSQATPDKDKPLEPTDAAKQAAEEAKAKERDRHYQAMGYKPMKRDGVTMYCRKEPVLGTRFSRVNCSTAENLERTAENAKQETDRMVRRSLNQLPSN
jgi:hypothetical protein